MNYIEIFVHLINVCIYLLTLLIFVYILFRMIGCFIGKIVRMPVYSSEFSSMGSSHYNSNSEYANRQSSSMDYPGPSKKYYSVCTSADGNTSEDILYFNETTVGESKKNESSVKKPETVKNTLEVKRILVKPVKKSDHIEKPDRVEDTGDSKSSKDVEKGLHLGKKSEDLQKSHKVKKFDYINKSDGDVKYEHVKKVGNEKPQSIVAKKFDEFRKLISANKSGDGDKSDYELKPAEVKHRECVKKSGDFKSSIDMLKSDDGKTPDKVNTPDDDYNGDRLI